MNFNRIYRQLEGPTNPKGAYYYPPWSGDSNSTIRVVQKSLVFANTLANLKTATLNYIFRFGIKLWIIAIVISYSSSTIE